MTSRNAIQRAYSPNRPIAVRDLFSGRIEQLGQAINAIQTPGRHPIIFGARGIGKTSLANVLADIIDPSQFVVVKTQGAANSTYETIMRSLLGKVTIPEKKARIGFGAQEETRGSSLLNYLDSLDHVAITDLLSQLGGKLVFIIDEFDRLPPVESKKFSDLIKAASDNVSLDLTFVVVGVSDNLEGLIEDHPSIERNVSQVFMNLMNEGEVGEILSKGEDVSQMNFTADVRKKIIEFSQGFPFYAHLLAQKASFIALSRKSKRIIMKDLRAAVQEAHQEADHSIRRAYQVATASARETTFPDVLYAAAKASCDEFGFFRLSDMAKVPLDSTGKCLKVQALQYPVSKLIADDRGNILIREGEKKRYRYRFKNPMMKQYIILRQAISRGEI